MTFALASCFTVAHANTEVFIPSYSYTPSPTIPNSIEGAFTVQIDSSGPDVPATATLTIDVAANVEVLAAPAGCSLSGVYPAAQQIICTFANLPVGSTIINYNATARDSSPGAQPSLSTATIVSSDDNNPGNNVANLNVTVQTAADLTLDIVGPGSLPAGSVANFTYTARNEGPDSTNAVQVIANLPAASEFSYQSASGSNWSCSPAGLTVTCDYTGAAVAPSTDFPAITLTGQVVSGVAGTLTLTGDVQSTSAFFPDPDSGNNTDSEVLIVTAGTDLEAHKTMPASLVNDGTTYTATLTIENVGPQNIGAGATIVDVFPAELTVTAVPAGCLANTGLPAAGATVTCTAGALNNGASQPFSISIQGTTNTVGATINQASVAPPAAVDDPNPANDTASASFQVFPPAADLRVSKSKSPNPFMAGGTVISTVNLRNLGASDAAYDGTTTFLRIVDTLDPDETLDLVATNGHATNAGAWTCSLSAGTGPSGEDQAICLSIGAGVLANGASRNLAIVTTTAAATDGTISNTACTTSNHTPADNNTGNNCNGAGAYSTTEDTDLAIEKTVGKTAASASAETVALLSHEGSYFIRLRARNLGAVLARTVRVSDSIPQTMNTTIAGTLYRTTITEVDAAGAPLAGGVCNIPATGGNVTCTFSNLAGGADRDIYLRVDRPFNTPLNGAGAPTFFTNTATISSPDTTDSNSANNSDGAQISAEPLADMTITAHSVTPDPALSGGELTYTLSLRNVGPNQANGVTFTNPIDATKFDFVSASTTKPGGSCIFNVNQVECTLDRFNRGQTYQVSFTVFAKYPFMGFTDASDFPVAITNTGTVATTSDEEPSTVGADGPGPQPNVDTLNHSINAPDVDLTVEKDEPAGGYDPVIFEDECLTYDVRVSNIGASRASGVELTDTPTPQAGYNMDFVGFAINPVGANAGFTLKTAPGATCIAASSSPTPSCVDPVTSATISAGAGAGSGAVTCRIDPVDEDGALEELEQTIFRLYFRSSHPTIEPTSPVAFADDASASSLQQRNDNTLEQNIGNNTSDETTTVLPKTDLVIQSKSVNPGAAGPFNINEPIPFDIVFRNDGPSPTTQVRITDPLPAGFVFVPNSQSPPIANNVITTGAVRGGAYEITGFSCSGASSVTCIIDGNFPPDSLTGTTDTFILTVNARAAYPFAGPFGANITNTATISAGQDAGGQPLSRDFDTNNNTGSTNVQIQRSSISGFVFNDEDSGGATDIDAGEGIAGVNIAFSGMDAYGFAINLAGQLTSGTGAFSFTDLPPGTYTLVESQPAGYFDVNETAPGGNGVVDNATYSNAAAQNTIANIALGEAEDLTNYLFQEYEAASVSGAIFSDANNDGVFGGGESGVPHGSFPAGAELRLTGTDYAGAAVNLTRNVNGSGQFTFTGVPPSGVGGSYTLAQINAPNGFVDGLDFDGSAVVPGSAGRPLASETMDIGHVDPGDVFTSRNFGEIDEPSISGFIYIDENDNAIKEPTETAGLANGVVTLTGTDDLGAAVNCAITTTSTGAFVFPDPGNANVNCRTLRPSDATGYTLTETPPPGLTHTGAYIGSAGGSAGAASGANTPSVGVGVTTISSIVVGPGVDAVNYNFGENGDGLLGSVYIDANNNGVREPAEQGIPGVDITISGTADTGQDLCTLIGAANCTVTTDASGGFSFLNLPGSNAAGYTLTEQSQAAAPLSNYGDGQETAGTVGAATVGVAGADVITGIILNGGELATDYLFGELSGGLSGAVYVDNNDDGTLDANDDPIQGVDVALSGQTADGQDICTFLGNLSPVRSCVAQSQADGTFSFTDLPASNAAGYTLTETHPVQYADGREAAGAPAGTVNNATFGIGVAENQITSIVLGAGQFGVDYGFGERGVTISGRVYIDLNRDGIDDTEDGLGGVTITLRDGGGNIVATTTTAPDGSYQFEGLTSGDYTVEETQPAGYGSSTPNTANLTLPPGGSATADFGETVSTLQASTYIDVDDDGVRDPGELGLAGVDMTLTGTNDAGDAVNITLTTDANGEVVFTELLSGTYTLTQTQPVGFSDGADAAGTFGGAPSGVVGDNIISNIPVPTGADGIDYDFGEGGQAVSGNVYVDLDKNGVQNGDDTPVEGVTIRLLDNTNTVIDTTTTDANGRYSFPDVEAGIYSVVEVQPAGYANGAENGSNTVPVTVGVGVLNDPINFGEETGAIAGSVFNDTDTDGAQSSSEPGIPDTVIRLTGTDARGNAVDRTTTTNNAGQWYFDGVVGGVYTVTETQPGGYDDKPDYAGDAGGVVGNDTVTNISLSAGQEAANYRFTEGGDLASIAGMIWHDDDHDRVLDGGEDTVASWMVELVLNGVLVQSATTDSNGAYQFTDIPPGSGYMIQFRNPENGAVFGGARTNENGAAAANGVVSAANPGGATITPAGIESLTLLPGQTITEQSLPLDPSGVVYNSVTSDLIEGAVVTFTGPAGFDPDLHLVGGSGNVSQTTGADGFYQFLLFPGAPAGDYTLTVTPPAGAFNPITPSSIIPPCPAPFAVGPIPDPLLIQASSAPPAPDAARDCSLSGAASTYFLVFTITPGASANVINNHLPIDPILEGAIILTKTTPKGSVSRGALVPYTITAQSTLPGPITDIDIIDRLPAGFKYVTGSGAVDSTPTEPERRGRDIVWPSLTFDAEQTRSITLLAVVGSGVREGTHTNEAYALNVPADAVVSNIAEAAVRVIPDPDVDCTDIIGKVWDDKNANGAQDEGEEGVSGARLATVRGLLITTDAHGRYHITCPEIANEKRGSNFVLKLDPRSLPTGYRMTTDNPETIRLTRGKFAKLNFGVAQYQVVRLTVSNNAFEGEKLNPDLRKAIGDLTPTLEKTPSVIRVLYAANGESKKEIGKRIDAIEEHIHRLWKKRKDRPRLIFESETVRVQNEGDVQ